MVMEIWGNLIANSIIKNFSNLLSDVPDKDKEVRLEQSRSQPDLTQITSPNRMTIPEATSDFNQWLHAMKMVARLPGGMPIEFRRKASRLKLAVE